MIAKRSNGYTPQCPPELLRLKGSIYSVISKKCGVSPMRTFLLLREKLFSSMGNM